jgi:hypothetical protein
VQAKRTLDVQDLVKEDDWPHLGEFGHILEPHLERIPVIQFQVRMGLQTKVCFHFSTEGFDDVLKH